VIANPFAQASSSGPYVDPQRAAQLWPGGGGNSQPGAMKP
jgi:hypothetical protein